MMPPRILIAEDDDVQGQLLLAAVERRGYRADIVTDGLEAVRRLRTGSYDVALLDYGLPEVDGLTAARLMQDFLAEGTRPRLIAVTSAAERLQAKEEFCGGRFFDAVVPKRLGLPALLAVIEDNVTYAAETGRAAMAARTLELAGIAEARRRRRMRAPLAAVPALAMVAAFIAAFFWATASLNTVHHAAASAKSVVAMSDNAVALLDAVHDVENQQRTYLATGSETQRDLFDGAAERVDHMLIDPAPLSRDGAPGAAEGDGPATIVEPWLRTLSQEAQLKQAGGDNKAVGVESVQIGQAVSMRLRAWVSRLIGESQQIVLSGLDRIGGAIELVLIVLALGVLYAGWTGARAFQRRWKELAPRPLPELHVRVAPNLAIAMVGDSTISAGSIEH